MGFRQAEDRRPSAERGSHGCSELVGAGRAAPLPYVADPAPALQAWHWCGWELWRQNHTACHPTSVPWVTLLYTMGVTRISSLQLGPAARVGGLTPSPPLHTTPLPNDGISDQAGRTCDPRGPPHLKRTGTCVDRAAGQRRGQSSGGWGPAVRHGGTRSLRGGGLFTKLLKFLASGHQTMF